MATKKKAAKRKPLISPEEELVRLYGTNSDYVERVGTDEDAYGATISVDDEPISVVDEISALNGCCGVYELSGVGNIAPSKKEAFAAVHALRTAEFRGAGAIATTNGTAGKQAAAAAFFRATGWMEIPLGRNGGGGGNSITLWVLPLNK